MPALSIKICITDKILFKTLTGRPSASTRRSSESTRRPPTAAGPNVLNNILSVNTRKTNGKGVSE